VASWLVFFSNEDVTTEAVDVAMLKYLNWFSTRFTYTKYASEGENHLNEAMTLLVIT